MCPQTGIYLFSLSLVNSSGSEVESFVRAELALDGLALATVFCDGNVDFENNQSSITVVTVCNAGSTVQVVSNGFSTTNVDTPSNVFSGVFISSLE